MNRRYSMAIVVAGLVLTLGGVSSWGQVPNTNDTSDNNANTGGGTNALAHNASSDNTAYGFAALTSNSTGSNNTATGLNALSSNTTGYFNTASGAYALFGNTSGAYNTALGYRALYKSTGSRNLALGLNAGFNLSSGDNNIYLGHTGFATESNTMHLGQQQIQTRTFIAGIRGVAVGSNAVQVLINSNGQLGTLVSSARYKRNIRDMRDSSQGLYRLRPVTFRYKQDSQGQRQYGLIAEEVAKVYPELVTKGADGKVESVQYHELIPMLLNEVQHQQQALSTQSQQIAELQAQNERLQAALVQQNAAVAARLERLEEGVTRTATRTSR